jgi:hypothetical protein
VIVNERWDAVENLYANNELVEPFGSQVRETFARSEPRVRAQYSAWIQAMRANAETIGNTRFEAGRLLFGSNAADLQYTRLKQQAADAQQRNNSARRNALAATDGVTDVLREILTR